MSRGWVPDRGWTGGWDLPDVLRHPVNERERGGLVALAAAGMGPARLVRSLEDVRRVGAITRGMDEDWRSVLAGLGRLGAHALVPSDEAYPDRLAEIPAPPPLLFTTGLELDGPAVAIVGARACTAGARRFAERLGEACAAAGFTVVSGLARGIDGAAHAGAVSAGRTIAVLGTGIDVCYPPEHRRLAEQVRADGALVTEFPSGVGPRAWHFPSRNRIIAGLSIATIVVEAGRRSGALITADFALDQGREVFACTTGPDNPAGAGVRAMLRDGARLVVDAEQAVEDLVALAGDLGYEVGDGRIGRTGDRDDAPDGELGVVYQAVTEQTTVDDVVATTGLRADRVAALLTELELDGRVRAEPGNRWGQR